MFESNQSQSEPQVFVLKQGPHESDTAFEARIGATTQQISDSAPDGPVIVYSVPRPALVSPTTALNS